MSATRIRTLFEAGDLDGLVAAAAERPTRVVSWLQGRLSSADPATKLLAVEAIGRIVEDPARVPKPRAVELLRRFLWLLNDESGAVPYGVPEALGEVLHRRADLRTPFVPILASFLVDAELLQEGPIERGVVWGLGRVGPPAADLAPHGVEAVRRLSREHPDPATRDEATRALARIAGG